jgi:hypothetical protein
LCSVEYSNEDIYPDLVCHFEDDASNWQPGDGEATLTGTLLDGTPFEGTDSICVVGGADVMYQLDVTYTNGSIVSGPLSFGLNALPDSVNATFILGPGHPGTEPGEEGYLYFDDEDLLAAGVTFGDATWTENDIVGFDMMYDGSVNNLTYLFSPITTQVVDGGVILNFPLTITGTDIASGQSFEYTYGDSTQTFAGL